MKRLLFIPTCTLLALGALTSCQKEEKSALELASDLVTELQTVTNYQTAEAAAPRVEVLNKRFQDASVRTLTLNDSALLRSSSGTPGHEGDRYAEVLGQLAREMARVRASLPVTSYDGEVDKQELLMAVGVASGNAAPGASAEERAAAGKAYLEDDVSEANREPGRFPECYGSDALKNALSYVAVPSEAPVLKFDTGADVASVPAGGAAPADESAEAPAEESAAADAPADAAEPAADAPAEETTPAPEAPAEEEPAADGGEDLELDLDL